MLLRCRMTAGIVCDGRRGRQLLLPGGVPVLLLLMLLLLLLVGAAFSAAVVAAAPAAPDLSNASASVGVDPERGDDSHRFVEEVPQAAAAAAVRASSAPPVAAGAAATGGDGGGIGLTQVPMEHVQGLFWPYELPFRACFRIPVLTLASGTLQPSDAPVERLFAFVEARAYFGDHCPMEGNVGATAAAPIASPNARAAGQQAKPVMLDHPCNGIRRNIYYKHSDDGGVTWSGLRHLAGGPLDCLASVGALFDPSSGAIVVQWSSGWFDQTWQVRSYSLGETWESPATLDQDLGPAAGFMPGPATGLALASGRMLFAGYGPTDWGKGPFSVSVWYSDDQGNKWSLSEVTGCFTCNTTLSQFTGSVSESQVVGPLGPGGPVLLSMRANGRRRAALSYDGGATFDELAAPPALSLLDTDTGLSAGMVALSDGSLYYSMALAADNQRTHMSVLRSDDGGASWPRGGLVYPGPCGYSALTALGKHGRNDTVLGLVWEQDRGACLDSSCAVMFGYVATALPVVPPDAAAALAANNQGSRSDHGAGGGAAP